MSIPIMPKATAVWLIDNTGLTFAQIADFCGLHEVEVQAIADGQFVSGLQAMNPIDNGQLTLTEIARCEKDPNARLMLNVPYRLDIKERKVPKYTPLAKRQDKPRAIAWLLKYYPRMSDAKICALVSATKKMVQSVRDRTYPNLSELVARDPVFFGFCTQSELNAAISEVPTENAE